jgi:hypothetical protein
VEEIPVDIMETMARNIGELVMASAMEKNIILVI